MLREKMNRMLYKIVKFCHKMEWGFCITVNEDFILLGDDAVSAGTQFPLFCGNQSTYQQTVVHPKLRIVIFLEGETGQKAQSLKLLMKVKEEEEEEEEEKRSG